MSHKSTAALSYYEPDIITILILSSFLLLENAINFAFDRLLFCGLIGQIIIGVAWGTPGANILSQNVQNTIVQLGYLGLILLVYEGGLSTDLKTLKSNLFLSSLVAIIGISVPIGLSFTLQGFMNITPVQAFAAGAALCSTSLGTTFTILQTSGLNHSRLGVVLSSAAMMDDIIGLVMSGIISSLGLSSGNFSAITVIRPVFVSIAFAIAIPLICLWVVKPLTKYGLQIAATHRKSCIVSTLATEGAALTLHTLILTAMVTGATYAGTSNLFAAYLAGAVVSWWDGLRRNHQGEGETFRPTSATMKATKKQRAAITRSESQAVASGATTNDHPDPDVGEAQAVDDRDRDSSAMQSESLHTECPSTSTSTQPRPTGNLNGTSMFEKYYSPALRTVLQPFFFASIGFSIPITRMFSGSVVWRGIIYTILMIIAKLACGLCLIRFSFVKPPIPAIIKMLPKRFSACLSWPLHAARPKSMQVASGPPTPPPSAPRAGQAQQQRRSPKPISLYPAALLGTAMVARGEIGFLISSVAETNGVLGSSSGGQDPELFLVVTWAILLCTLLGPISVGILVRRVKRLQRQERADNSGKDDPLGIWGVLPSSS